MTTWPSDIPHDLDLAMEEVDASAADAGDWLEIVVAWMDGHRVRHTADVRRSIIGGLSALDGWIASASNADRWTVIKENLEAWEIEAPDTLPPRPEIGFYEGRYG